MRFLAADALRPPPSPAQGCRGRILDPLASGWYNGGKSERAVPLSLKSAIWPSGGVLRSSGAAYGERLSFLPFLVAFLYVGVPRSPARYLIPAVAALGSYFLVISAACSAMFELLL